MGRRRKTRARGGFSLVETLVAVVILSILSSAAMLAINQALKQRNDSIQLADAQTVASTAAQVISDQLRYGRVIGVADSGTILLASGTYGTTISMGLSEGQLAFQAVSADASGQMVPGGSTFAPLGEKAYCGLRLTDLRFTVYQEDDRVDRVETTVSVAQDETADPLWSLSFSVTPVNPGVYHL